ncbi:tripartite tricarboxylate transporter substrate binding protein [Pseudomonas sp. 21LCFQ02]|uniref:Bug family tripartite tricarboxylate transporter substrate binding protein n=1 Tax=Pseudomonas sp. 21LCFQ02 TaxID=2957505 RepID=UPI00209B8517|nr:tripartite tricarboxylate transporter substrate binding protein [Pseudomonas sp. 21LCFQ02]MCO8167504.1 tripartite tricarboxylate transporter substrate binding protein [Pseudomonas sp. 21LCFQ02]
MNKLWRSLLCTTGALLLTSISAFAETYPSRPVSLIVPFPPGGGADVLGRVIAQKLSEKWDQPVVVENRPGAGGLLGATVGAHAKPDGYTLVLMTASISLGVVQAPKRPFDPLTAFDAVALLAKAPMLVVANPKLKVKTLPELVALAKKTREKLSYGGTGQGGAGNLAGELLKKRLGLDMVFIPYSGAGPAVTALLADEVPLVILDPGGTMTYIKEDQLQPIATVSKERFALLPEVPSLAEYGVSDVEINASYGVVAPKGTPSAITEKIAKELATVLSLPDVRERLTMNGQVAVGGSPEDYAKFLAAEYKQFESTAGLLTSP